MDDAQYCQKALVQLRVAVGQHFDQAMDRQPGAMQCKAGCSQCCKPGLSVFGIEGAKIEQALLALRQSAPKLRQKVQDQGQEALDQPSTQQSCPLLVDDHCTVYEQRPLICRSHGLPIKRKDSPDIQNCALNFQESAPQPASILALDALNLPLSVSAEMWHRATSTPLRVSLASLAAQD